MPVPAESLHKEKLLKMLDILTLTGAAMADKITKFQIKFQIFTGMLTCPKLVFLCINYPTPLEHALKTKQTVKSNTPNRHRFTVETFASAERVQDTYHEKLIEANVKSDLMSPWFIPHFKTAFHAAHVLNSYRVYRGSLRNFWIFSLYVSRHVQALPYLHLITTSETTVFSLPALAQKK